MVDVGLWPGALSDVRRWLVGLVRGVAWLSMWPGVGFIGAAARCRLVVALVMWWPVVCHHRRGCSLGVGWWPLLPTCQRSPCLVRGCDVAAVVVALVMWWPVWVRCSLSLNMHFAPCFALCGYYAGIMRVFLHFSPCFLLTGFSFILSHARFFALSVAASLPCLAAALCRLL